MGFTRVRITQRRRRGWRWDVVMPLYDVRECPFCMALVRGDDGQRIHYQELHEVRNDDTLIDGYVIGNGELPASMMGEVE